MKVSNAVIGGKVQIKRDCTGNSDEFIKGGLVCTVSRIQGSAYELRLKNPNIEDGYAWVNASDCRKYKEAVEEEPTEPTPEPVEESEEGSVLTPHEYRVGDKVLVGAEGAGNNLVHKEYANLVCTIEEVKVFGDVNLVEMYHPNVMGGHSYTSKVQYITPYKEPTPELTCADVQVGDWLVFNEGDRYLQVGTAYQVVEVREEDSIVIANHTSTTPTWQSGYWTRTGHFNKVLREVTPRG